VQYRVPLEDFYKIWEGGLVFYGSIMGGTLGFTFYYYAVLRKQRIPMWVLADIIAPTLALGVVIGRFGCLLNGCCYGQVAPEGCAQLHFPLLTGPVRSMVVGEFGYQTPLGFSAVSRLDDSDPRTQVKQVEPGSEAEKTGLLPGDKIVGFNGLTNGLVLFLSGTESALKSADEKFATLEADVENLGTRRRYFIAKKELFLLAAETAEKIPGLRIDGQPDHLTYLVRNWPKGAGKIQLDVERNGQVISLDAYTPRSVGLQPTQLYESISMALMVFLLLSFYPFRRHDGQVMVVCMIGYACHRFLNEMLRNDTKPVVWELTASMAVSLVVFVGAIILEVYLRCTQPRRRDQDSTITTSSA
jgi:phosphatidylglycerol---prolipoprotein diacylglyceryl transferase